MHVLGLFLNFRENKKNLKNVLTKKMDFGFDDDLFEPVKQKASFEDTVNEMIKGYVAKQVTPCVSKF